MRKLLLMLGVVFVCVQLDAQQRTIIGKVTDSKGNPIPNASILVKGTKIGTTSQSDGTYSLVIPATAKNLVYSSVGMTDLEISIGNKGVINAELLSSDKNLQEVVVVGYGTQRKKDVTGNVAIVKGDAVAERPVQSFEGALAGRAAGVQISSPNGVVNNPPVFRIRGTNSISLSSYPLIVVDGVPTYTGDIGSTNAAANALASISPNDIESIDIAKDAASSAIYGSRAANGVVFITTKKGKQGRAKITYDGWVGVTKVYGLPKLLNAQQYVDLKNEGLTNAGTFNSTTNYFALTNGPDGNPINTSWYDYIYRTGVSHSNYLSISGGNESTTYYGSVGYTDQQGIIRRNDFNRRNVLFSVDSRPSKYVSMGAKIAYSNEQNLAATSSGSLSGEAFNTGGLARLAIVNSPAVAPYKNDGSYNLSTTTANTLGQMNNKVAQVGFYNPVVLLDQSRSNTENNHIQANTYFQLKPVKWLQLRTAYGIDYLYADNDIFQTAIHGDGFTAGGTATDNLNKFKRWVWTNTAQFDYQAGKHTFGVLAGEEEQRTTQVGYGLNRQTLADPSFNNIQSSFLINNTAGLANTENYLFSLFGRLSYNYASKYYLTGTVRQDQYSAFGPAYKKGTFWSASAGWEIAKEAFWTSAGFNNVFSSFKLRGSYGTVGNSNIGNFDAFSLYGAALYGGSAALTFTQVGNPNLKWENTAKTDFGISFGILKDRITGDVAYYNNNYKDLVLNVTYAPSVGLPNNIPQNIASLYNKGFEFTVNALAVSKKNFSWNTSFNFATNQNKVTQLNPAAGISQFTTSTSSLETVSITKEGYPIGTLFVTRTAGVDPNTGRRIFVNAAGQQVFFQAVAPAGQFTYMYADGTKAPNVSSADAVPYKNTNPKLYGGWDNTFRFKDFELNMLWTFQTGFYVYYGTNAGLRDQRFWNNSTDVLRRWKTKGDVTDIPKVINGDNVSNGSSFPLDINVFKGDFAKLRTLTLSYYLPRTLIEKTKIASAKFYVSGQNLAIITKYPGPDPEVSSNGNANNSQGIDRNGTANGRVLTVGLNIGF